MRRTARKPAFSFPAALALPHTEDAVIRTDTRVNRQIRAREVRLVAADGKQVGVVPIEEALRMAEQAELDLVEVAAEAEPPVCRICDFKKILYDQKKKIRESKKKAHQIELKEIKLRISIDDHDLETKLNHARKFFEKGDKVKFTIQMRGREVTKPEIAIRLIQRVMEEMKNDGDIEQDVQRMGKMHHFIMGPKPKKPGQKPTTKPAAVPQGATAQAAAVIPPVEKPAQG